MTKLQLYGDVLDANNEERYNEIYKTSLLAGDSIRIFGIFVPSIDYQSTYKKFMQDIVGLANELSKNDRYMRFMPIVVATSGYNPSEWIDVVPSDVLKAREACRIIVGNKSKLRLV